MWLDAETYSASFLIAEDNQQAKAIPMIWINAIPVEDQNDEVSQEN